MKTHEKLHTPYDGSSKPFTIGLQQLNLSQWIDPDPMLAHYLDEKQRLTAEVYDKIVVSEPSSETAQQEVLDLLSTHVCERFPEIYQRKANTITIVPANLTVDLADQTVPKLHVAASLVQEDLVLMRKSEAGWRLVAASLCFPSAWNLLEKFGKPMHEIHAPVPGFSAGTRNAALIERMFDNLQIDRPVLRWNWSLYGDNHLYHPESGNQGKLRFGENAAPENINLRLERQTLRKLPMSQDILFTIRIYIDPLQVLRKHPEGPALSRSIADQIAALSAEEIAYKGLTNERQRLLVHLNDSTGLLTQC